MARLEPTDRTIKMLFALSGNQCAYPGCTELLVDENENLIAEICHIEAAEPLGKRHNREQTDDERRHFSNLIILCPTHHVVSDDVNKHSVQYMQKIKLEHENKNRACRYKTSSNVVEQARRRYTANLKKKKNIKHSEHVNATSTSYKCSDIFLYFVCREFQEYFRLSELNSSQMLEFIYATKMSLLFCKGQVLLSPSALVETTYAKLILDNFKKFKDYISFSNFAASPTLFREKKIVQYKHLQNPFDNYRHKLTQKEFDKKFPFFKYGIWVERTLSRTSKDISIMWKHSIHNEDPVFVELQMELSLLTSDSSVRSKITDILYSVPERLEKLAFITEFVINLLPLRSVSPKVVDAIRRIICKFYISSYLVEYNATCLHDLATLDVRSVIPGNRDYVSLRRISMSLKILGVYELFCSNQKLNLLTEEELLRLRQCGRALSCFQELAVATLENVNDALFMHDRNAYLANMNRLKGVDKVDCFAEMLIELHQKYMPIINLI